MAKPPTTQDNVLFLDLSFLPPSALPQLIRALDEGEWSDFVNPTGLSILEAQRILFTRLTEQLGFVEACRQVAK